jgi:hypothetical protein
MDNIKFHNSQNYKVVKAEKVRSDGQGKPRAIICRITNDVIEPKLPIESLVVWQDKNPRLYKKLAKGILTNRMPILNGITVVLNSTSCYYVYE